MLQVVFPIALLAASPSTQGAACVTPAQNLIPPPDEGEVACFPSPDGRKQAQVRKGRLTVHVGERSWRVGRVDTGRLYWNPTSTGFAVADSGGSGETNYFSYVDLSPAAARRMKALRVNAVRAWAHHFHCASPRSYAHAWFEGWEHAGHVRLRVVEGVHSEGCAFPDPEEISIRVIGDPITGRIDRVLTQAELGAAKSP